MEPAGRRTEETMSILYITDDPPAPPPPRNPLGTSGLLVASLGSLFTFGLLAPLGLLMSLAALRRAPRRAAKWGVLFGLLGTGFLVGVGMLFAGGVEAARHARETRQARQVLREGDSLIRGHLQAHPGDLPSDYEGTKLLVDLRDPWGESPAYFRTEEGYRVVSSGPDRRL